jgi:hypothetical protein
MSLLILTCADAEKEKLAEARNAPSTEEKSAELRKEILRLTKLRLKIAKQYTVSLIF